MSCISNLNNTDFLIMFLTLFSMLYGYIRGFIKESLSIISLITSSIICIHLYPSISEAIEKYVDLPLIADGISLLILFLTVYSIFGIISNLITKNMRNTSLKILDKNFGIIFGFIRSIVILSLLNIIFTWTLWKTDLPEWLENSKSINVINHSSKFILNFLPEKVLSNINKIFDTSYNFNNKIENLDKNSIKKFSEPILKNNSRDKKEGYNKNDNESLDRLFNIENDN